MERAAATERFSILKEAAAGSRVGKAWAEENPTHPGIFSVAEFAARGRDFAEYAPVLLPQLLGLHTEAWRAWWARWGSDQPPSHSFARAFCLAVCTAPLPAGVAVGRAAGIAGARGVAYAVAAGDERGGAIPPK